MINLKKLFYANPYLLPVTKAEKDLLALFLSANASFEPWMANHPQPRIRFQFYFPTAIDFYFDDHKLFTAFFKKGTSGQQELSELKISRDNYNTVRVLNWKPFEEVIVSFLQSMEETNKATSFHQSKSLYEYASICEEAPVEKAANMYGSQLSHSMATG